MDKVKEVEKKIRALIQKSITHEISAVKYRNKRTGEIATQIPIMEMGDWERADKPKPKPKKPNPATAKFSDMIQYQIDKQNWRNSNRFN